MSNNVYGAQNVGISRPIAVVGREAKATPAIGSSWSRIDLPGCVLAPLRWHISRMSSSGRCQPAFETGGGHGSQVAAAAQRTFRTFGLLNSTIHRE